MKKLIVSFIGVILLCLVLLSCGKGNKSIVGKWVDVRTEATYEYTADGYFYEYPNENFTSVKTRYTLDDGKITYYLDGDTPDSTSAWSVPYEITEEGHLIIAGEIEYRPLVDPRKADKE